MANREIPYKIYLEENELPRQWYNVRADMKNKPAPLLNPGNTCSRCTLEELDRVFCDELAKQELDDTTPYFDIPQEIIDFYKMYRPARLSKSVLSGKGSSVHLPRYTTNSRATTQAVQPQAELVRLLRLITPRNRA